MKVRKIYKQNGHQQQTPSSVFYHVSERGLIENLNSDIFTQMAFSILSA